MTRTSLTLLLRTTIVATLSLALFGCQPADQASVPTDHQETVPSETGGHQDRNGNQPDDAGRSTVPAFSAEQIATARQLAKSLGVVVKENASGDVIGIDTAARRSWVDDTQMEQILVFPKLQALVVEGPNISHLLAPQIAKATHLTSLTMQTTMITDEGVTEFKKLKSLKVIDLRLSPLLTDAAMATLAAMPQLRAVRLSGTEITDQGLVMLLQLPQLTELDLRNCRGITQVGFEKLAARKTLRTLKIGGATVDDQTLERVGQMRNLTGLSLDNGDISDAGIAKLASLPLVSFTIYQCANISDLGLDIFATLPNLQRLTLRDVGVMGSSLGKLPHPELLVTLNMAQSQITDAEVIQLEKMSGLKELTLSETALTDTAIDALAKLTSLIKLSMTQTQVTQDGFDRLAKALPNCAIHSQ